jgi:hypothetical protein
MPGRSWNPGYEPDNWWGVCDRCGLTYRIKELVKEWNGAVVCRRMCYEPRHPQDFVKAVKDSDKPDGLIRPFQTHEEASYTYDANATGADYAQVPAETYTNSL